MQYRRGSVSGPVLRWYLAWYKRVMYTIVLLLLTHTMYATCNYNVLQPLSSVLCWRPSSWLSVSWSVGAIVVTAPPRATATSPVGHIQSVRSRHPYMHNCGYTVPYWTVRALLTIAYASERCFGSEYRSHVISHWTHVSSHANPKQKTYGYQCNEPPPVNPKYNATHRNVAMLYCVQCFQRLTRLTLRRKSNRSDRLRIDGAET